MLLGSKQRSSTKTVKDSMAGLAWEVLSCNGIRNYKLDLLSYRHSSTLLTLSIPEVLYFNKLSKTVLQKIKFNYYRKAIKHQFWLKELETQAYKYFFLNIEKLKMDIFKNEFRICIFVIVFFSSQTIWLVRKIVKNSSICFWWKHVVGAGQIIEQCFRMTGNALARVQRVHAPADLWDITFCTRWFWGF